MAIERLPEEILHDPEYSDVFIAVKIIRTETGERTGEVIASGENAREVLSSMNKARKKFPNSAFYFARPTINQDMRDHWKLGQEE